MCVHEVVRSSFNAHCPGSVPCHDRGGCATRHPAGDVCATIRLVAQHSTCEVVPIVLCILCAWRDTDLDSEWTCKCTGSWTGARCDRYTLSTSGAVTVFDPASTSSLQNNRSSCSTSAQRRGGEPTWDSTFRPNVDRVPETSQSNFPLAQDAAAPFLITFFDNWWYEDSGTAEPEDFLWTRLQGQPLGHGIGKQC